MISFIRTKGLFFFWSLLSSSMAMEIFLREMNRRAAFGFRLWQNRYLNQSTYYINRWIGNYVYALKNK